MSVRIPGTAALALVVAIVAYGCGGGSGEEPALPSAESATGAAAATTFTVADRAAVSQAEFARAAGDPRAVQHYLSATALSPSTVTIATPASPGASPGYLFLAPYQGQGARGPMIVDQSGGLVWFHPLSDGQYATNFGVQRYAGAPALTWWQGRILRLGFGEGEIGRAHV